jgi:Tol biopolymer transport system component
MKPVSVMALLSCVLLASSCRGSPDRQVFGPVSFSPDGKTIVFSHGNGNECSIYKADLASGHAQRLTKTHAGCESDPTFSPDGKLIAYSYISAPGAKSALFVMNDDGSNARQISSGSSDDLYPIFATDTHAVYFARARFFGHYSPIAKKRRHDLDLFSVDLRNSKEAEITEQHFFDAKSLCLSPDGKELLISTSRGSDRSLC